MVGQAGNDRRPDGVTPEKLLSSLADEDNRFFFVGDCRFRCQRNIVKNTCAKAVIPFEYQYLPRGAYAACEVWEQWKSKDRSFGAESPVTLEPLYIRLSEAEVNYRKKHLENS
jgi:tRNA threonylcarbamoyladenosine biosynthesis protein TsaB